MIKRDDEKKKQKGDPLVRGIACDEQTALLVDETGNGIVIGQTEGIFYFIFYFIIKPFHFRERTPILLSGL